MQLEKCFVDSNKDVCDIQEENATRSHENCVKFSKGFEMCRLEVNKFLFDNEVYVHVLRDMATNNVANIRRNYIAKGRQEATKDILGNHLEDDTPEVRLTKQDILEKIRKKIFERKRQSMGQIIADRRTKVWRPWLGNKTSTPQ